MKAAVLEKVGKIVIKDVEKPDVQPGHVLIKIDYVGICGSDVHYYEHGRIGDFIVKKPIILGHECSGSVEAIGDGTSGFSIGDKVVPEPGVACNKCDYCKTGKYNLCNEMTFMGTPPIDGAFREYVSYPADMVFKLPENVTTKEGALIEPLAIGIYAVQRAGVFPGAKVLVLGAGCIGLVTMLAAKAFGASQVIETDVLDNRLEVAKKLGADFAVNTSKKNLHELIADTTSDTGVDVVIDCVGISPTINDAIDSCKKGGTIVLVGMGADGNVNININRAISKEIDFKTIFRYRNIFPTALKMVSDGKIDIKGIVSHSYDFEQIAEAMEFVMNNKEKVVKAIIKISD
ncbi:MAG: NAD(P)-dependent alcohol dehydrogenase [Clostridiales bacterium]|nr:NAD(P)-dependent alcohol dehydrogenase [Clostridiales bacterium]